jgi:signal transduction histidine kinase
VTREREVERMKSAFLGMAAHELNTPLTTIIGYTELLASADAPVKFSAEQARDCLNLIHHKALSLSRLVDDLLDISRIESGQPLAINRWDCCLNDVLHEVLDSFREQNGRHSFELLAPDEPLVLHIDCGRIQQVLLNLVSNAVKYSPAGGTIRVVLETDDRFCRIVVADEGIGMTEEQLDHIFDRFYRADFSNTAVQGAGLGMNIARHIVEAHGGEIRVASQFGSGTQVTVELPLFEAVPHSVTT